MYEHGLRLFFIDAVATIFGPELVFYNTVGVALDPTSCFTAAELVTVSLRAFLSFSLANSPEQRTQNQLVCEKRVFWCRDCGNGLHIHHVPSLEDAVSIDVVLVQGVLCQGQGRMGLQVRV